MTLEKTETFESLGEAKTAQFARSLAARLFPGDVLLVEGPLGAGKSVLARALIRALTGNPELDVPSPTFTLVQTYEFWGGEISHFDFYRLESPEDVFALGWEDAAANGIAIVEWPERLGSYTPKNAIKVTIAPSETDPQKRTLTLTDTRQPKAFSAFVLAAGLGTRLRPYTDTLPKPLVPVCDRPLLDYIFDHLKQAGVSKIAVNLHHKPEKIRAFLKTRENDFLLKESFEETLLDTGGGAKKVLPFLSRGPFLMINGDAFWLNGPGKSSLDRLKESFDPAHMDILLLLEPVARMALTGGVGDYDLDRDGRARRSRDKSGTYMFTGIRVCAPHIFAGSPNDPFSFLALMDRAEQEGRLFGLVHDGEWHHISTPQDLESVNAALRRKPKTS